MSQFQVAVQLNANEDILGSLVQNTQNDAKKYFTQQKHASDATSVCVSKPLYKYKIVYKTSKKCLAAIINPVTFTNGKDRLKEEKGLSNLVTKFINVPWLGVDRSRLEIGETVRFDIDPQSTYLPVFCKILIIHQGAAQVNSPAVLARDISIQIDMSKVDSESTKTCVVNYRSRASSGKEEDTTLVPYYQYKGKKGVTTEKEIQCEVHMFHSEKISTYAATTDLIKHITIDNLSSYKLMSPYSLENRGQFPSNEALNVLSPSALNTRSHRIRSIPVQHESIVNKRESSCPLTGSRRVAFSASVRNSKSTNFWDASCSREHNICEKYEEYYANEMSTDTRDLAEHIDAEKYSFVQLLSERVKLENELSKMQRNFNSRNMNKLVEIPNLAFSDDFENVCKVDDDEPTAILTTTITKTLINDEPNELNTSYRSIISSNDLSAISPRAKEALSQMLFENLVDGRRSREHSEESIQEKRKSVEVKVSAPSSVKNSPTKSTNATIAKINALLSKMNETNKSKWDDDQKHASIGTEIEVQKEQRSSEHDDISDILERYNLRKKMSPRRNDDQVQDLIDSIDNKLERIHNLTSSQSNLADVNNPASSLAHSSMHFAIPVPIGVVPTQLRLENMDLCSSPMSTARSSVYCVQPFADPFITQVPSRSFVAPPDHHPAYCTTNQARYPLISQAIYQPADMDYEIYHQPVCSSMNTFRKIQRNQSHSPPSRNIKVNTNSLTSTSGNFSLNGKSNFPNRNFVRSNSNHSNLCSSCHKSIRNANNSYNHLIRNNRANDFQSTRFNSKYSNSSNRFLVKRFDELIQNACDSAMAPRIVGSLCNCDYHQQRYLQQQQQQQDPHFQPQFTMNHHQIINSSTSPSYDSRYLRSEVDKSLSMYVKPTGGEPSNNLKNGNDLRIKSNESQLARKNEINTHLSIQINKDLANLKSDLVDINVQRSNQSE
jgi:hypothetical protein